MSADQIIKAAAKRYRDSVAADRQVELDAEQALPSIARIRDNNASPDLTYIGQGWNGFFTAFSYNYSPERFKRDAARAILRARAIRLGCARGLGWAYNGGTLANAINRAGDRRFAALNLMKNEKDASTC